MSTTVTADTDGDLLYYFTDSLFYSNLESIELGGEGCIVSSDTAWRRFVTCYSKQALPQLTGVHIIILELKLG